VHRPAHLVPLASPKATRRAEAVREERGDSDVDGDVPEERQTLHGLLSCEILEEGDEVQCLFVDFGREEGEVSGGVVR
jgi:hypothetical protein